MKQKIIGVGITGLVGSRIVELCPEYEFINASSETGVDITDFQTLVDPVERSDSKVIIHLAAKTNVDSCEDDKIMGKNGQAWKINVGGTENIIKAGKSQNKKIIYVSTDYVFDGEKNYYTEEDTPNPINWYARTKYEGELLVKNSGLPYTIVRITYPYRANFVPKKDFVRTIIDNLNNQQRVKLMNDHIFTPTLIDDIALAIKIIINHELQGIYHLVGSQSLTPLEAGKIISNTFGLDPNLIESITSKEYLKGRAPRPLKLATKNDKIKREGAVFSTFEEGLNIIKNQLED